MEYDRQRDSQFNFNSLVGMMLTWWTGLGDNINGLIPDFIIQYSFSSDHLTILLVLKLLQICY